MYMYIQTADSDISIWRSADDQTDYTRSASKYTNTITTLTKAV